MYNLIDRALTTLFAHFGFYHTTIVLSKSFSYQRYPVVDPRFNVNYTTTSIVGEEHYKIVQRDKHTLQP